MREVDWRNRVFKQSVHRLLTSPASPEGALPYYAMPYHTILYHTRPYHTILCHTIPRHTISYYSIPYHTLPHLTIPYHTIPHHAIPGRTILARGPHKSQALAAARTISPPPKTATFSPPHHPSMELAATAHNDLHRDCHLYDAFCHPTRHDMCRLKWFHIKWIFSAFCA